MKEHETNNSVFNPGIEQNNIPGAVNIETVNSDLSVTSSVNYSSDLSVDTVNHSSNISTVESDIVTDKPKRHGMENLIPFTALTEEQQREIACKGGKASVEAKRKKKHLREVVQAMLAHSMTDEQISEVLGTAENLLDGDKSVSAVLTARMIQEAAQGNVKAYETLRDTGGYKPKDQVEVENITDADRALLARIEARQKSG